MRLSWIPILTLLVAGSAGCAVNNQPPNTPQGYGRPGQWSPLEQPGGPSYGQQPYAPQPYAPQPYGQQPYSPQPYGQQPYAPQPWAPPAYFPVNVPALLALQGRVPCAPKEVAPGTWATFDCAPFQAIQQAAQYIPLIRFNFLPSGPLPASVDHRLEGGEGPVKDQGAVGACTALSLSTAMESALRRTGDRDVISALHLWSRYGVGIHGQAGDSNVGKTVTTEQVWPYDPVKACKLSRSPMDTCGVAYGVSSASEAFDPALKAEHARADANGRYRLASIERLHAKPADPGEIAAVLAGGDDVWISFSVNDEAWMNRSLQNGVIPDYETVGDTGHAVVLAGYRTVAGGTKQFLIHNSWSARWGEGGYGWISEAMVSRYTRAAYRVKVTGGGGGGSVPSLPAAPSGDGGCPQGQVKDPIFGACIPGLSGGPGGFPGLPGFPSPGQAPAPSKPAPAKPAPQGGACPSGQVQDMMNGSCVAPCAGGAPPVGGMCLPLPIP